MRWLIYQPLFSTSSNGNGSKRSTKAHRGIDAGIARVIGVGADVGDGVTIGIIARSPCLDVRKYANAETASTTSSSATDPQMIPAIAIPEPAASPRLALARAIKPSTTATIAAGIAKYQMHRKGIEQIPQTMLAIAMPLGNSGWEEYCKACGDVGGGKSVMVLASTGVA